MPLIWLGPFQPRASLIFEMLGDGAGRSSMPRDCLCPASVLCGPPAGRRGAARPCPDGPGALVFVPPPPPPGGSELFLPPRLPPAAAGGANQEPGARGAPGLQPGAGLAAGESPPRGFPAPPPRPAGDHKEPRLPLPAGAAAPLRSAPLRSSACPARGEGEGEGRAAGRGRGWGQEEASGIPPVQSIKAPSGPPPLPPPEMGLSRRAHRGLLLAAAIWALGRCQLRGESGLRPARGSAHFGEAGLQGLSLGTGGGKPRREKELPSAPRVGALPAAPGPLPAPAPGAAARFPPSGSSFIFEGGGGGHSARLGGAGRLPALWEWRREKTRFEVRGSGPPALPSLS